MTTAFQTGHVGLNVSNLERSSQFYKEVFGLKTTAESSEAGRRFMFLSDDSRLVLTLWEQSAGQFDKTKPGLHHLSFQVENVAEVEQAEQRLKALSVKFVYEGLVPHGEGASSGGIYFEDPDGTRLEIYTPSGVANSHAPVSDAPSCGFF